MPYIHLRNIRKSFGKTEVIKNADIAIEKGQFVCFVGPSGCGKSTLLRMIAGLERQSAGDIVIDGTDVNNLPPAKRGIAMVFQTYALYPHLNVRNNMALALKQAKMPKAEIEARIRNAAEILQLGDLLGRRPAELSGGQRQRVAIGRSLVRQPKVFLLDEPLSNLDAALRGEVRVKLAQLHKELRSTMIYVTHDQVEAMTLADQVVILNRGGVEQKGTPMEVYFNPANLFVAGFIGTPKMNILKGIPENGKVRIGSGWEMDVQLPLENGAPLSVGIRPEHWIAEDESGEGLPAEVLISEKLGSETYVYLNSDDGETITVKMAGTDSRPSGARMKVRPNPARTLFFDGQGKRVDPI